MIKSRCYEVILYDHNRVKHFETICIDNGFDYAYILHDKDIYPTGELKESHFHFILYFSNARSISSISSTFDIAENYIEKKDNLHKSLEYLIHKNHKSKYQYYATDVVGTLSSYLLDKTDERIEIKLILDYIDSFNLSDKVYLRTISNYCLQQNLWSTFRRNNYFILKYIEERNFLLTKNK